VERRVGSIVTGLRPMIPIGLGARPRPKRVGTRVVRPEDLLVLTFYRHNLRVEAKGNTPHLVKIGGGPAYLIVEFPPQHIVEKAFFKPNDDHPVETPSLPERPDEELVNATAPPKDPDEGKDTTLDEEPTATERTPPIEARIADPSRLVFTVTDDDLPLDWTLPSLLDAMQRLELSVAANALPSAPRVAPLLTTMNHFDRFDSVVVTDVLGPHGTQEIRHLSTLSRERRKLRVTAHLLGLSDVTGSATVDALALPEHGPAIAALLPVPAAPSDVQTAIEAPYRLKLSPSQQGAWVHALDAVTSQETGRTELWHTRLGTWVEQPGGGRTRTEDRVDDRIVRAIWTRYPDPEPKTPKIATDPVPTPSHDNFPFRMSLDSFDRVNIVHLSSNFRLREANNPAKPYAAPPVDVNLLQLSALGSWLDTRGAWQFPQPRGLSVEEWRHRATLGRDHYVRIVYAGRVMPCGHRTVIVKITEREFHDHLPSDPAYLRQQMGLVVIEPIRRFRQVEQLYWGEDPNRKDERLDLMFPFEFVRITTLVSPPLDPPEWDDVGGKLQSCFWPSVNGQPFQFHVVATDAAGKAIDLTMPMLFIGKELTDPDYADGFVAQAVKAYEDHPAKRATVDLLGQRVAYAREGEPDDTTLEAESFTFGMEVPPETVYDAMDWRLPRWLPVMRRSAVNIPSMQRIAKTTTPTSVHFDHHYLAAGGFGGSNAGEVFLATNNDDSDAPPLSVAFSSQGDRSGALVTPDLQLSGVSRITGPVAGEMSSAAKGEFVPQEWFGGLTAAKLFGAFSLTDVIAKVTDLADLGERPRFMGQSLNVVEELEAGLRQLQADLEGIKPHGTAEAAAIGKLLDQPGGSLQQLLDAAKKPGTDLIPFREAVEGDLEEIAGALNDLADDLDGLDIAAGPAAVVGQRLGAVLPVVDEVKDAVDVVVSFAKGDVLPDAVSGRFEWRPRLVETTELKLHGTNKPHNLVLSVDAAASRSKQPGGGERLTVTASLDDFSLELGVVSLSFERVLFRVRDGKKPDVDVRFAGFAFGGPLSFVETLRELIPADGFSDPPDVSVTSEGITAGYSQQLPNLAVGVFSLQNLSIAAGFSVPFVGKPVSVWFRFTERENPALVTVSVFGGGFFFGIVVNPDGLQVLEGAIEFGAAIAVNFGVAAGGVSAMAGLYFKIEAGEADLAGYFRLRGEVEALGIVSVSIELYLELRYKTNGKCTGTATIEIEVDLGLVEKTISLTETRTFAGAGDPTFGELMTSDEWAAYCAAFE
jgi:hypothetical protein